jgi:hypothetical protein
MMRAGEILGFTSTGYFDQELTGHVIEEFNERFYKEEDQFSTRMISLRDQNNMGTFLDYSTSLIGMLLAMFITAMSIILWNAGLLGGLRRYGEFGMRLAIGEEKNHVYKSMIIESLIIGLSGSVIGVIFGMIIAAYLQKHGIDMGHHDEKCQHHDSQRIPCKDHSANLVHRIHPGSIVRPDRNHAGRHRDLQTTNRTFNQRIASMKKATTALLGITLSLLTFAQVPDGKDIMQRIDQNLSSDNRIFTSKMIIHGIRSSRSMESRTWTQGEENSFTEYLFPVREQGTKMLKLENQLWIYSPTTDRIIQITGHMLRQAVMGSDMSYEDLMEDSKLLSHYDAVVMGSEKVGDQDCWVVELTAFDPDVTYQGKEAMGGQGPLHPPERGDVCKERHAAEAD